MREQDLYQGVENFLNLEFRRMIQPKSNLALIQTRVTANAGPAASGTWSRPDLALISLWKHKYSPSLTLDLYGFEVKNRSGGGITGVHEALAHTRIVNFSSLVWELHPDEFDKQNFLSVRDNCAHFGVGLFTFENSSQTESYKTHVMPKRKSPEPDAVDEFIETRFDDTTKKLLLQWLPRIG